MPRDYFAEEIEGKALAPKRDYFAEEIEKSNKPKETIPQLIGRNFVSAVKETAGMPLELANQASAGLLRPVLRRFGTDIPEQKTLEGKVGRGLGGIVGFTAGLPGKLGLKAGQMAAAKLPFLAGKKILPKVAKGAIEAGTSGLVSTPEKGNKEGILKPMERIEQGAMYAGLGAISPVVTAIGRTAPRIGAMVAGVEKETLDDVAKRGFRKVLQSKYYNKKMPPILQERIENNLSKLEEGAGQQYDELTAPLREQPFDLAKLRGDISKIASRVNKNPFETDISKTDKAILDGIMNRAEINNLGDALDLRRNLDEIIYNNQGELKTKFGSEVRKLLNNELHKVKGLEKVDAEWSDLQEALREGRKVIGDTGEKLLGRFSSLTEKQKAMLVTLEKRIGGEPFIEDLTNWSLAKQFTGKASPTTIGNLPAKLMRPAFRGALRTGEVLTPLRAAMNRENAVGTWDTYRKNTNE